jgi:legumain
MFKSLLSATLSLAFLSSSAVNAAKDWVVLVSGSNGYDNYRHHADVCHAYQIVSGWGVPNSQIIVMLYDDVANSPYNPFPGQLFNKPTPTGTPGIDVYKTCQKDYVGQDVTAENFLKILVGDTSAGGKVINSTSEDNIFLNFVDHGAPGFVAMPAGPYLYAADLIASMNKMYAQKRYSKLVFYVEACESGSMFEGLMTANQNTYITTASNAVESSWGTYCSPDDQINGQSVGSCLGDLYSVNWMENSDEAGQLITLDQQFQITKNKTDLSHVMQYGDANFNSDAIGFFQGNMIAQKLLKHHHSKKSPIHTPSRPSTSNVDSRDIELHNAYARYVNAKDANLAATSGARLSTILATREHTDSFFRSLASSMNTNHGFRTYYTKPSHKAIKSCGACCKTVEQAIRDSCGGLSDYGLKYFSVVFNMCEAGHQSEQTTSSMVDTVKDLCVTNGWNLGNVPL